MEKHLKGYTLIELFVVLGLMTIAFTFLIIKTGNEDGVSLKSSQRILSAIAQGAKGQAVMKQTPARLIIYAEKGANRDENKYLRFCGIVTQDPKNPRMWIAGTKGTYLPKGIYFMPELSKSVNGQNKHAGKMYLEYPRIQPQANNPRKGEEYYYYEFNANGTTAAKFVNSWLVFGAGTLEPRGNQPKEISFENQAKTGLKSGLIFRKIGSTTLVTDSDQIDRMAQRNRRN